MKEEDKQELEKINLLVKMKQGLVNLGHVVYEHDDWPMSDEQLAKIPAHAEEKIRLLKQTLEEVDSRYKELVEIDFQGNIVTKKNTSALEAEVIGGEMQVTDADRHAINRVIAERLGERPRISWDIIDPQDGGIYTFFQAESEAEAWLERIQKEYPKGIHQNAILYKRVRYPDFFSDANAADRVLAWLKAQKMRVILDLDSGDGGLPCCDIVRGDDPDFLIGRYFADDWKEALALACVERGEFCPMCKEPLRPSRICVKCKEVRSPVLNWRVRPELEGQADDKGN